VLREIALAVVLGVLPLVAGILLGRLVSGLYGDWLRAAGPALAGVLVGLLQELARLLPAVVLGWGCGWFLGRRGRRVALLALLAGYLYLLALRALTGTLAQLGEPAYLAGKLVGVLGVALVTVLAARHGARKLLDTRPKRS